MPSYPEHSRPSDDPFARDSSGPITSVAGALDEARRRFGGAGGPLFFLPSATRSARRCPFARPARVLECFETLARITARWRANGGAFFYHGWYAELRRAGFRYKPDISPTTLAHWGDEYTFRYDGARLVFAEHVTIGGTNSANFCVSVHWWRDHARRVLVIGHCGRHLTNTST